MNSFWDNSWEKVDRERVTQYVDSFGMEQDNIIKWLHSQQVRTVCDAGCGCGIYTLKLSTNGFVVSGFDVSGFAVKIAQELLRNASVQAELKTASVLSTGYPDNWFDGVVSRDVIDHMRKKDAIAAVRELYRILKPGGILLITLDSLDSEYETEHHTVNDDGDFLFTEGKWNGMVFHPYEGGEIHHLIPSGGIWQMEYHEGEMILQVKKPA